MEPLKGYVFVFTGEMEMDRDAAKSMVLMLGARATTAVSSKTTHLVAGSEPGPSKMKKAEELNIKIIDEGEFKGLLEKHKPKMEEEIRIATSKEPAQTLNKEQDNRGSKRTSESWAEKYRPKTLDDLVGNKAVFEQLDDFLKGQSGKKAALVSGSPGVGKTSAVLLICKLNGITPIEFNASDFRSKKSINDHVSKVLNNSEIFSKTGLQGKALIMDEVDGMTSDRGGIPELVNLIKKTKIPIVCICNDKTHPKMRTLAYHCLDLHCRKLDSRMILPRIKYILDKENKSLTDGVINEIILNSNGDLRYIINTIQSITTMEKMSMIELGKGLVKKNVLKGVFEVAAELFQRRSIGDKINLYFEDYSLMPLFVQENYIKCAFKSLKDLVLSADSISFSDLLDARIHGSEQEWSLMPYHAFFSTVYPLNQKTLQKRLDFPMFLGQNSKMGKNARLLKAISSHFRAKSTKNEFRLYIADFLYRKFVKLLEAGQISDCIDLIVTSDLLKDDITSIGDVLNLDIFKSVSSKYKTALTREYNKIDRVLPYKMPSYEAPNNEEDDEE